MIKIEYVKNEDKDFWYKLDKHLPEEEFEKKIRDKQGYKDCGGIIMNIPGYEQPMEMFLCKAL